MILSQDILDGFWNLNPQTKLLIEKEKTTYELIEKLELKKKADPDLNGNKIDINKGGKGKRRKCCK